MTYAVVGLEIFIFQFGTN